MDELKRCPWCGILPETRVKVTQMGGGTDIIDFSVVCPECGADKRIRLMIRNVATFMDAEKAMAEAIEAWNKRVNE